MMKILKWKEFILVQVSQSKNKSERERKKKWRGWGKWESWEEESKEGEEKRKRKKNDTDFNLRVESWRGEIWGGRRNYEKKKRKRTRRVGGKVKVVELNLRVEWKQKKTEVWGEVVFILFYIFVYES